MSAEEVKTQLEQRLEVGFGQDTTDGTPVFIRIHKGGCEIYASPEQALSLAAQITKKFGKKGT